MILAAFFGWAPSEYDRLDHDELEQWVAVAEAIAKARKEARL